MTQAIICNSKTTIEISAPSSIETVIFDLDGTLLDTESLSDKAILFAIPNLSETIRESYGPTYLIPWELKKQLLGLRGSEWAPIVLQYAHDQWNVPIDKLPSINELWSNWESNLNEYCRDVELCPGAMEIIQKFVSKNIPMGIATSSRTISVAKKRARHESTIFQYMTTIITGDHPAVKNGKPAPDIYLEAAKQLDVTSPKNCLVFEDALSGIRSAKSAGCYVVAIPDPRYSETEKAMFHQEADLVLNSLLDFDFDMVTT